MISKIILTTKYARIAIVARGAIIRNTAHNLAARAFKGTPEKGGTACTIQYQGPELLNLTGRNRLFLKLTCRCDMKLIDMGTSIRDMIWAIF